LLVGDPGAASLRAALGALDVRDVPELDGGR
jgi:hypothetical protein